MLRSETDITVLVLALVVVSKGVASGFSTLLVEPAARKYATRCLNPHHRGAGEQFARI
jgi:hypothetical protein